jgi:dTDP-4-amino-4,6-dideoxy-D-galactose acyltransferase
VTEVAELLEWDSHFFGVRTGRLANPRLDAALTLDLARWMDAHDVACVYCLLDAADMESVRVAESCAARFVDVRMTYSLALENGPLPTRAPSGVRGAERRDIAQLEAIAAVSHHDSRFYSDQGFPRPRVDELYRTWLRTSIEGSRATGAVTLDIDGRPCGYVTFSGPSVTTEQGIGEIGLVAVDRTSTGRGAGTALLNGALDALTALDVRRVRVVTQGRNVRAQRLYQRAGFRIERVELWFHAWRPLRSAVVRSAT